jgi:hypothetical protein
VAEDLTLRRRFRQDLEALLKQRPRLAAPERLDCLTQDLEAEPHKEHPHHEHTSEAEGEAE